MINIGLIGAGPNGTGNIKNLCKDASRARLAAVADLNAEAAQQVAKEYGDDQTITVSDYTEFFDAVDMVVISSPNWLHPEQAIACANAGKHVWIEKPMALSIADADRICEAVDRAGVQSFVGFSVRFGSVPRTLGQTFKDGTLGELRSIWSRRLCNLNMARGWRSDYAKSGGVMSELIAHEIDWMIDIAGLPTSVYCRIQSEHNSDPRDNDHVWLTFGFADGSTGTIEGAQTAEIADYYKGIVGTKGTVHDRKWGGEAHIKDKDGDRQMEALPGESKHDLFLDALEGKAKSVADVHWGRIVVAITEKALESAVSGQVVDLTDQLTLAQVGAAT